MNSLMWSQLALKNVKQNTAPILYLFNKISIIGISLKDALNEESWPEGIFVRCFSAPKMESTASAVNTSDQNIKS